MTKTRTQKPADVISDTHVADLISQEDAAQLIGAARRTIQYWEQQGWITTAQAVAAPTGKRGRPARLYNRADIIRVAIERGRNPKA